MAAVESSSSILAACSPEAAFNLLADVSRHTEIFANNEEIRGYHGGQLKEGDSWVTVSSFMGRKLETTYTLTEHTPHSRLVFHSKSTSAEGEATWTFEPVEGGTSIKITGAGEPKGFFASLAAPLLKGNLEKMTRENLERIKAALEA